jgi:hypothetical protein
MDEKALAALISLLDDTDPEVFDHVSGKLLALGPSGIPRLEAAWESTDNQLVQSRLEDLIGQIQFDHLADMLAQWKAEGCEDLQEAAVLIARFHYPDLDHIKLNSQIERIVQSVWINMSANLSPAEEVQVLNKVFFGDLGFKGNKEPKPEVDLGYLNIILDTRNGNSIGLGMLYMMVAQALDISIYGVNLPYHFILCYTRGHLSDEELESQSADAKVMFYINPLLEGIPFGKAEINRYLEQSQIAPQPIYYAPCSNRLIILSLIYNQMSCYEQANEQEKADRMRSLLEILQE